MTRQRRDEATRTARHLQAAVVRTSLVQYVLFLAAFVVAAGAIAPTLEPTRIAPPIAAVAAVGGALSVWMIRRILHDIDRLDQERHGLREAYDRARLDSLRDGLTGLGNHRAFQEELQDQVELTRETGLPFALLLVDVDDLKRVNDSRGHAAGDELLRAAGAVIRANLRRGDRGFRIGGDEFAILLHDSDADGGQAIGRRILAGALEGGTGTHVTEPFSLTIGVASHPSHSLDRHQLIRQADAALYWGKRHGRTEVVVFNPERHGVADDHRPEAELALAVTRVTRDTLLTAVYQPIFSLQTGEVLGYEGLVRPDPGAGFANPTALFAAAEATRRSVELDIACVEAVLAGSGRLDPAQYLSLNLSPRTLEAEGFSAHEFLAILRRHGYHPDRIVVELTEREAVEHMDRLRQAIGTLRRYGVRVAADDVGAGNAGLRLLSEVDFDIMKIDLSLVRAGARRDPSEAVLRALIELARRRGQRTVAEGIETPDQLGAIRALGIDAGQGYLLGRPGPELRAERFAVDAVAASEPAGPNRAWPGAA